MDKEGKLMEASLKWIDISEWNLDWKVDKTQWKVLKMYPRG